MPPAVVDLSHNALIAVRGDDAASFLHAQLTSDVLALPAAGAQWSGWCSPKGRLLATFLLLRHADGFLLVIPAEIAAPIARRLGLFVLRSKVKIEDATPRYGRIGIVGGASPALVERHWGAVPAPMASVEREASTCVALEAGRFLALVPADRAAALLATLEREGERGSADDWERASIRAGVATIVAATQEAFVPQMANFDLIGGVSFRKGCYPGQEIVARTQYRGTLKRRMALAHLEGTERPAPGESVYSAAFGEQAAGTIVSSAPAPEGGFDSLVVAQIESIDRDDLRWNSPQGPRLAVRAKPPTENRA
jgi:folate-binding protein YgfZ